MKAQNKLTMLLIAIISAIMILLSGCGSSTPTGTNNTGGGGTTPPVTAGPAAPTGVTATASGSTQINIDWTLNASASYYNIYRSTTSGFTISLATKIASAAAGPFGNTGLTPATTYYYKVTAVNAAGIESAPSAEVNQLILLSPTSVTAVEGSNLSLLSWNAVTGITSYNIYWSSVPGVTKATGAKIPVNGYSYQHMGLTNSTNYYYVVTAVDSAGHESPESAEVSCKPELGYTWTPRFSLPAGLTGIAYSGTKFVAVGRNGHVATTTDGNIWISYNSGITSDFRAVIWAGTQFVAVTGSSSVVPVTSANPGGMLYTTDIVTSPDGITWTIRYSASSIYSNWLNSVAWSGTQFVAVGQNGSMVSSDGITWGAGSALSFSNNRVVWAGNKFLATGLGQMNSSTDGITWTLVNIDPTFSPNSVVWSGTQYVAVGSANGVGVTTTIYTSPDSVTWTPRSSINISPHSILWTGKVFIVRGYDTMTLLTSTDGVTWASRTWGSLTTSGVIGDMAASNNVVIGLGLGIYSDGGFFLTSP